MTDLERAIADKKRVVEEKRQRAEEAQREFQEECSELAALEQAHAIMQRSRPGVPRARAAKKAAPVPTTATARAAAVAVESNSGPALAIAALRAIGVPAHLDVILKEINAKGAHPNRDSLRSALGKLVKRKQIFYRTGQPYTFGLIEWGANRPVAPSNGSSAHNNVGKSSPSGVQTPTGIVREIISNAPAEGITGPQIVERVQERKQGFKAPLVYAIIFRLKKSGEIQAEGGRGSMVYRCATQH